MENTTTTTKRFRVGIESTHYLNAIHYLSEAQEEMYNGATHKIGESGAGLINPLNDKIEEAKEAIYRFLRIHIEAQMCDVENTHRQEMEI